MKIDRKYVAYMFWNFWVYVVVIMAGTATMYFAQTDSLLWQFKLYYSFIVTFASCLLFFAISQLYKAVRESYRRH